MSPSSASPSSSGDDSTAPEDEPATPFKDAEAWLAERGIERDPIDLTPSPEPSDVEPSAASTADSTTDPGTGPGSVSDAGSISARDAQRLAGQATADARLRAADEDAHPDPGAAGLDDDVAEAVAFVRRSTSGAPQAEGRIRTKLAERGWSPAVIDVALERARRERLIDDPAMAAALVAERRAKGHAVARIRKDLRERGFEDTVIGVALGDAEREDPEAAAFAVAQDKAARLTGLTAETAFRRVVGHVARRGYPEGLARKVAREAVFSARDAERTAGH